MEQFNIKLIDAPMNEHYDAIILAVAHNQFRKLTVNEIKTFGKIKHVIYDVKYLFKADEVDGRL